MKIKWWLVTIGIVSILVEFHFLNGVNSDIDEIEKASVRRQLVLHEVKLNKLLFIQDSNIVYLQSAMQAELACLENFGNAINVTGSELSNQLNPILSVTDFGVNPILSYHDFVEKSKKVFSNLKKIAVKRKESLKLQKWIFSVLFIITSIGFLLKSNASKSKS